jgi:hypothetical protein
LVVHSSKEGNPLSERRKKNTKEIAVKGTRWCLWDKVKVGDVVGFISGFSTPGFNIRCITGELYKAINVKQATLISRNNNWIIQPV